MRYEKYMKEELGFKLSTSWGLNGKESLEELVLRNTHVNTENGIGHRN